MGNCTTWVLTLRGLQLENSLGVEWLPTLHADILNLVESFDPKIVTQQKKRRVGEHLAQVIRRRDYQYKVIQVSEKSP